MSVIQVGLVDKTGKLDVSLLQSAANAFNLQVMQHVSAIWNVDATVRFLPSPDQVPPGVWPVFLVASLPPGEGGFHLDEHNQPYAKVVGTKDNDGWTIAASHEIVEMLVDPNGNRMQASQSIEINKTSGAIEDGTGQFSYLMEACDPCEADPYSYPIAGIAVSDFITPHFYDATVTPGTRYSYTGAITRPRQILPGGYISWIDPVKNEWQQLQYLDPKAHPVIKNLGPTSADAKSLREWLHTKRGDAPTTLRTTRELSMSPENTKLLERCAADRAALHAAAASKAKRYPF
jgi:hypothetical protein